MSDLIIYKTTNLVNDKIYIGKASNASKKNNYLGSGKQIKYAIMKYGKANFKRKIIDIAENKNDHIIKEIFWINFFDARNRKIGYNILPGGNGGSVDISEETKRKISKQLTGRKLSKETKQKMRKPKSEETKRKIGAASKIFLKGRKNPKHSERMKGENNPMSAKNRIAREKQNV